MKNCLTMNYQRIVLLASWALVLSQVAIQLILVDTSSFNNNVNYAQDINGSISARNETFAVPFNSTITSIVEQADIVIETDNSAQIKVISENDHLWPNGEVIYWYNEC